MTPTTTCPICQKRKAERFCPAKGEKICAVCCATEREVTIECPVDCGYLVAAHRYEAQHRKPLSVTDIPFPDVEFSPDLIHERGPVVSGLGFAILKAAAESQSAADADVLAALQALAETYRTLGSGIIYEKPPAGGPPQAIYAALVKFLEDYKREAAERGGAARLKDTDAFHLLVFLLRVGRQQTNGRPRSRMFLEFLRSQFPREAAGQQEAPRIIVP
ncbi:MAG: B-box zinc finger protein [Candidatus Acidiferrales bacterium]